MKNIKDPGVAKVFDAYPEHMRKNLLFLRRLVFETAAETDDASEVEETLKWGEPAYVTKSGSTIRIDWKVSRPGQYAMYFHCKTRLLDTFREIYGDMFTFEGNRAIVFEQDARVPVAELKHCIALSLTYKRRRHLPLLGV